MSTQLPLTFTADTPRSASLEARPADSEAARHRADLLNLFRSGLELTADEAGNRVGLGPLSARPRVSELARKFGILEPTGDRRPSAEGNPSTVWRIRQP